MGKPYDHRYFFSATSARCGTMVCSGCHKQIEGENTHYVAYKKSKAYDWGFVTFHRSCYHSDAGWTKQEKAKKDLEDKNAMIVADMQALAKKHKITSAYSLADCACVALGESLEELL